MVRNFNNNYHLKHFQTYEKNIMYKTYISKEYSCTSAEKTHLGHNESNEDAPNLQLWKRNHVSKDNLINKLWLLVKVFHLIKSRSDSDISETENHLHTHDTFFFQFHWEAKDLSKIIMFKSSCIFPFLKSYQQLT